jgi:hypothetical protein
MKKKKKQFCFLRFCFPLLPSGHVPRRKMGSRAKAKKILGSTLKVIHHAGKETEAEKRPTRENQQKEGNLTHEEEKIITSPSDLRTNVAVFWFLA